MQLKKILAGDDKSEVEISGAHECPLPTPVLQPYWYIVAGALALTHCVRFTQTTSSTHRTVVRRSYPDDLRVPGARSGRTGAYNDLI